MKDDLGKFALRNISSKYLDPLVQPFQSINPPPSPVAKATTQAESCAPSYSTMLQAPNTIGGSHIKCSMLLTGLVTMLMSKNLPK